MRPEDCPCELPELLAAWACGIKAWSTFAPYRLTRGQLRTEHKKRRAGRTLNAQDINLQKILHRLGVTYK